MRHERLDEGAGAGDGDEGGVVVFGPLFDLGNATSDRDPTSS
jgi:hypothetical protein